MLKRLFTGTLFIFALSAGLFAQGADPVLFTVAGAPPVNVSEFNYIYAKTNQGKADFSEASLREYLNLYVNFKLKVKKARDMRLDTVEATKSELEGYRRQLANSYLIDREVTDRMVRDVYERMKLDVDVSHILVACDRNAKIPDTIRAYNRAMRLLKQVRGGALFENVARDSSNDQSAKENMGHLGFITAMLPDGYYHMEKAIYEAKPGDIVGPVRSNSGYHLVRVEGFRPARGEMEVAHILLRKVENDVEKNARIRLQADSLFRALQNGAYWEDLCNRFSDDKMTSAKGGYIGFFGINRYQKNFEDAAFSMQKDGDFVGPVETSVGWHIVKRLSLKRLEPFETMRRPLADRVRRDSRNEVARQSMVARIQKEGAYRDYPEVLAKWAAKQVDTVFLTFRWKPDPAQPQDVLARYGDKTFTLADFEAYCAQAGRERMRGGGNPVGETIDRLYRSWSDDVAMQFEETQLDKKYPDFKALMREYEEGILLFETLKINVWDRANADSVGLAKFYNEKLQGKFMWDERARTSLYTVKTDDPKVLEKVRAMAAKKPAAEVLKKMNKKTQVVSVMERVYEAGRNAELLQNWKQGALTGAKTDAGTKTATFLKVEEIMPRTQKALSEARGYAVADYQDYLEKQWIEDLRKQYPVKIDEAAFKTLVKK